MDFGNFDARLWLTRWMTAANRLAVLVVVCLAMLVLVACGDATVPVGPTVDASPTPPAQKVIGLAFTIRQAGVIVESVNRGTYFTVESGPRCLLTDVACPRPSRVSWRVSGAFCEILGDITGPSIVATCGSGGVTRIDAVDLDSGASGTVQIEVRF